MKYINGSENTSVYQEFINGRLRTKDDILRSLDKKMKEYNELAMNDHTTPPRFFSMFERMMTIFIEDIKDAVLFDELPDWWIYDYDLEYDRFYMYMEHVAKIDIDDRSKEIKGWRTDAHYNLVGFSFKTLSVSEYAELYNVKDVTVRQWIRRGKIRTATKIGAEWMIPVLTVPPKRGYEQAQYRWGMEMENLPDEYQYLNEFKQATFFQDRDDRDKYHVLLVSKENEACNNFSNNRELILDSKEREKLELVMIARPEIRFERRY